MLNTEMNDKRWISYYTVFVKYPYFHVFWHALKMHENTKHNQTHFEELTKWQIINECKLVSDMENKTEQWLSGIIGVVQCIVIWNKWVRAEFLAKWHLSHMACRDEVLAKLISGNSI